MDIFRKDGIVFHAYPKGDGKNESAVNGSHGDYHVHLDGKENKVVTVDRNGLLTPENPKALTKKELQVLKELNENERMYLRKACKEVFHNNQKILPRVRARYFGGVLGAGVAALTSGNSHLETCERDVAEQLEEGVCERRD